MDKFERLKADGIAHGMCQKFQDEWQEPNVAELSRMFFRGMDFCIEKNWPSMELARETFDAAELAEYGIFIKSGTVRNKINVAVLGDSEVNVYVRDFGVCDIYARHDSKVHIHAGYRAFVYVSVFDNSTVVVKDKDDGARIKSSHFGGTIVNPEKFDTIHEKANKEG